MGARHSSKTNYLSIVPTLAYTGRVLLDWKGPIVSHVNLTYIKAGAKEIRARRRSLSPRLFMP